MRWKGIESLPLFITGAQVLVYLFNLWDASLTQSLIFYPPWAWAGEWWRVVTFLLIPPISNPLYTIFWLYLFYTYADALETEWGARTFTAYYFIGALATILTGLFLVRDRGPVPNFFLNSSIFLAFASLFPNFELLIFFILPVKVKYLGILTAIFWAYIFIAGGPALRWIIAAALLNYVIFFGPRFWSWLKLKAEVARNRRRFKVE